MAVLPTSGYVGSLTPTEEAKLQEFWTLLFTTVSSLLSAVYNVPKPEGSPHNLFKLLNNIKEPTVDGILDALKSKPSETNGTNGTTNGTTNGAAAEKSLDKVESLVNKADGKTLLDQLSKEKVTKAHLTTLTHDLQKAGLHHAEIQSMEKILTKMSLAEMCFALLKMAKQEHPDTLLLRFLRARKWDVNKAFGMMANAIYWRQSFQVDDDVVPKGELHAWDQAHDAKLSKAEQKEGKDFIAQLEMGKSYLHGLDRQGRPVNIVRVKLHKPGAQTAAALERYIVHVIESTRILVAPPVETGTILFDMTGFTLGNMEYHPVKFIIQCFEANYPESLGLLLIHNAPWIFSGIWKIIHGWMDPVVASKVQFTKNINDLDKFIPREKIPKELGGDQEFTYKYIEPESDENAAMADKAAGDAAMVERMMTGLSFVAATAAWISASKTSEEEQRKHLAERRDEVIERFRDSYWKLDPYVRARALIDRRGAIKDGVVHDF
ncbi:CRAL-TRIO domain-containing protein [Aspergillus pseudoustus]|uniref:CRAL-TRIO domain-containing protein n=1 Tax=Aspergillus pseudoustus TaxID=1810923 RepID=A0ABR4IX12_9EURO